MVRLNCILNRHLTLSVTHRETQLHRRLSQGLAGSGSNATRGPRSASPRHQQPYTQFQRQSAPTRIHPSCRTQGLQRRRPQPAQAAAPDDQNGISRRRFFYQAFCAAERTADSEPTRRGARHTSGSPARPWPAHASSPRTVTLLGTLLARKALHLGLRPGHRKPPLWDGRGRRIGLGNRRMRRV